MKRLGCMLAALVLLFTLSACRARVDLSVEPELPDIEGIFGEPTDGDEDTPPEEDEMAAYAWELYSAALEKEEALSTYALSYASTVKFGSKLSKTDARITCVTDGRDAPELLVQVHTYSSDEGEDDRQGYYKDGVGYFDKDGKKVWQPLDADGFYEEMGFTETDALKREVFAEALVKENEDGTRTVSCPFTGKNAARYAKEMFGLDVSLISENAAKAEFSLTVDSTGAPVSYTSRVEMPQLGVQMMLKSENRYDAVGDAVTLTPPADLDSYQSELAR